ncbi:MAG: hypothetical protein RLZZ574_1479 [Cyanobacteriota bacterium]
MTFYDHNGKVLKKYKEQSSIISKQYPLVTFGKSFGRSSSPETTTSE